MEKNYKNLRLGGFTLVELLVVISIIALLLSVMMPALNKARDQGKSIVCKSNLRQVGLIFAVYAESNKGFFPRVGTRTWDSILLESMKGDFNTKNLKCPSDRSVVASGKYVRSYAPNVTYYSNTKTINNNVVSPIKKYSEYFVMGERHGQINSFGSGTISGSPDSSRVHSKNTTCFYTCADGHVTQEMIKSPDPRKYPQGWAEWKNYWWGSVYHNIHWLGQ